MFAGQVVGLPFVVVHEAMPDLRIGAMSFHVTVPAIGLEDGDDVDGVSGGEWSVSLDDDEVVVICIGRLEPRLCEPVISTGFAPNGSSTMTLLWMLTMLAPSSSFSSCGTCP